MTYNQAKLRVWNNEAYSAEQVREAAIYILGSLSAKAEDVQQASSIIAFRK